MTATFDLTGGAPLVTGGSRSLGLNLNGPFRLTALLAERMQPTGAAQRSTFGHRGVPPGRVGRAVLGGEPPDSTP